MKDYLVKAIDKTKNLRLITVDAKDLVSEAQKDMILGVHLQLCLEEHLLEDCSCQQLY